MFFGKKQTGFTGPIPAVNMVNEGFAPEQQFTPDGMFSAEMTEMGYACDPCGYCGPFYEHSEMVMEKPQPQIYVVQKGDTVYKIARQFGLDWRELAGYNHLGNPDLIYPGERLFIPPRY